MGPGNRCAPGFGCPRCQRRLLSTSAAPQTCGYDLTPEQLELQAAARSFAQQELPSLAVDLEASNQPVCAEWRAKFAKLGFLGVNHRVEHGGLGLGHLEAIIVLEEFAKISSAVAFPLFECLFGMQTLLRQIFLHATLSML